MQSQNGCILQGACVLEESRPQAPGCRPTPPQIAVKAQRPLGPFTADPTGKAH